MLPPKRRSFAAALACQVLASIAFAADSKPLPQPASTATVAPASASRFAETAINLDFPGGTLAQLIVALESPQRGPFNLIGEKALQDTPVVPFTLRGVEITPLISALNNLLRPQGVAVGFSGPNIFTLTKVAQFSYPTPATANFQAIQVGPFLSTHSIEEITDAIKSAWQGEPTHGAKTLELKYHAATKLLFVYGPPEALALASSVVAQLNPAVSSRLRSESLNAASTLRSPAEAAALLDLTVQEIQRRRANRDDAAPGTPVRPAETK